ncbi:MAG: 4Fe-4S single cluster domain-containing protein [bacterium]
MSNLLNINDICFGHCPLLGPSLYIWVQGCRLRCPGCFNFTALDREVIPHQYTPKEVAQRCLKIGGGLILSGGEPFLQSKNLTEVCRIVRATRPDTPILAYTGYTIEELIAKRSDEGENLLREIDILIDGPFDKERLIDDPLIGSSNQRIFRLSSRVPHRQIQEIRSPQIQISMGSKGRIRVIGTGRKGMDMTAAIDRIYSHGIILE